MTRCPQNVQVLSRPLEYFNSPQKTGDFFYALFIIVHQSLIGFMLLSLIRGIGITLAYRNCACPGGVLNHYNGQDCAFCVESVLLSSRVLSFRLNDVPLSKTIVMKASYLLALLSGILFSITINAQKSIVEFKHFIEQHEGLDNVSGELVPIGISEIEHKINFFIEEKFPDLVERIDNTLWDSYESFTTHSYKNHQHKFISVLKLKGIEESKFFEVIYDPNKKTISTEYQWSNELQDFIFNPSLGERERGKPDLLELAISNQTNPPKLKNFIDTHNGFIQLKTEKNRGENNFVPIDVKQINQMVSQYVSSTYPNIQYTRNIVWKSYSTFISPYSSHHFHIFLAQVKVKGVRTVKYLEVFFNPVTNTIKGDFQWDDEKIKFVRPVAEN